MAITFTPIAGGEDNADAGSYLTGSFTLTAGRLYLGFIDNTKATAVAPSAVATTGGAVTFTAKTTGVHTVQHVWSTWYAVPASTVTDTVTITTSSGTGIIFYFMEIQGTKISGSPAGADAFVPGQVAQNTSNSLVTNFTLTLPSNIAAGNARYTGGQADANETLSVTSGTWTSGVNRAHGSPTAALRVGYNAAPAPTDTSATWTGSATVAMGGVMYELAASTAGDSVGMIPI